MYLALYRKYRPKTFAEVVGQNHIITTLQNQIKEDKIGHAYLFCGSRGTGKTSTAKIFAKAINCKNLKNGEPCFECDACKASDAENFDVLEIDAASNNGVDEIRELKEKIKYPPTVGKYKVYIIDEVHMLSTSAFNALLKTLEEPPKFVVFILATTEPHKLPATILSRCMRFDFRLLSTETLEMQLEKICKDSGVKYSVEALNLIAKAGEGSVRDMLSVADRCIAFSGGNLTAQSVSEVLGVSSKEVLLSIATSVLNGNVGEMLESVNKVLSNGQNPLVFSRDLIGFFRDILFIKTAKEVAKKSIGAEKEIIEKMEQLADLDNFDQIVAVINNLSEVEAELRYSVAPRSVLECALIKAIANKDYGERIAELERKLENSGVVVQNNNQNVAKVQNTQQYGATSKEKTQNNDINNGNIAKISTNSNIDDEFLVLGELMQTLRKERATSLVAALGQVKQVSKDGNSIEFVFDDDTMVDMISSSRNKILIDSFFREHNLTYSFVSKAKSTNRGKQAVDLSKIFGDKLKIDN